MAQLRTTHRLDPELARSFDGLHIDSYEVREVVLPKWFARGRGKRALEIVIRGRNLQSVAQPLVAFVGGVPVSHLRIASDERSVDGLLLKAPRKGARVRVELGDQDAVQHAHPYDPADVVRIP